MITDAQTKRNELRKAGYAPIPLFGKEPPSWKKNKVKELTDWPDLHDISAAQIAMRTKQWPDARNTGMLTRHMPTLDLDILKE